MAEEYKEVLEIGFGGNPLGVLSWHPDRDAPVGSPFIFVPFEKRIPLVLGSLPEDVRYTGIDFPDRLSEDELAAAYKKCRWFVDGSVRMIDMYDQLDPKPANFAVRRMDGRNLEYDNSQFDETHLHFVLTEPVVTHDDGIQMLKEARRVTKTNGNIIITGERFTYDNDQEKVLSVEDRVRAQIEDAGLQIAGEYGEVRDTVLGDLVWGLWCYMDRAESRIPDGSILHQAFAYIVR